MAISTSDLAVRRYERYGCDLPAQIAVAAASGQSVKLARSAAGAEGRIAARVVDCSQGGVGIQCAVFFPLTCAMRLWMTLPDAPGAKGGDLELNLRIQRTAMLDRKPTYYLGGSFDGRGGGGGRDAAVSRLLAWLKASGAPLVPEKSRA